MRRKFTTHSDSSVEIKYENYRSKVPRDIWKHDRTYIWLTLLELPGCRSNVCSKILNWEKYRSLPHTKTLSLSIRFFRFCHFAAQCLKLEQKITGKWARHHKEGFNFKTLTCKTWHFQALLFIFSDHIFTKLAFLQRTKINACQKAARFDSLVTWQNATFGHDRKLCISRFPILSLPFSWAM